MSFLLDALRAFLGGDAERDDEHDVAKDSEGFCEASLSSSSALEGDELHETTCSTTGAL